jgi:DNA-binding NtrC family response regulator
MSDDASRTGEPPHGRGERILYLDDEEPLVFLVTRMLKQLGYKPSGFTRPAEALAAFRGDPKKFSLVLTDLSMPGASGMDFARDVLATSPGAPVVIVSGCVDPADAQRATLLGVRAVIQKPSTIEELGHAVGKLLGEITAGSRP